MSKVKAANESTTPAEDVKIVTPVNPTTTKTGMFIVLNTRLQRGLRIDLSKIRSYAKSGTDANLIQISYDQGGGTTLQYGNEKEADEVLDIMDSYCL